MKFSITEDFNQTKKSDIQLLFTIIFQDVIDQSKRLMLQCATGESVLRLSKTRLSGEEAEKVKKIYTEEQHHESLLQFLQNEWKQTSKLPQFLQVRNILYQPIVLILCYFLKHLLLQIKLKIIKK